VINFLSYYSPQSFNFSISKRKIVEWSQNCLFYHSNLSFARCRNFKWNWYIRSQKQTLWQVMRRFVCERLSRRFAKNYCSNSFDFSWSFAISEVFLRFKMKKKKIKIAIIENHFQLTSLNNFSAIQRTILSIRIFSLQIFERKICAN
jgi:hypothetical protein